MNNLIRAKKYIQKNGSLQPQVCCYGLQGPTGPTGIQGPTGAQGVTGPTGPSFSIDSILTGNDGSQTVGNNGLLNLGQLINSTGSSLSFVAPNQVIINESGTYLINFSSIIDSAGSSGDLGVSLRINGTIVPTASEYINFQSSAFSSELQHNYNATAGDVITVINSSAASNIYHDSTLSIIRLV